MRSLLGIGYGYGRRICLGICQVSGRFLSTF